MQKKILVTGANGFVGRHLCPSLVGKGLAVRAAVRLESAQAWTLGLEQCQVASMEQPQDWSAALTGVDRVIHLAARVHVMEDHSADPLGAFRRINVDAACDLARQAAAAGVRRFVYLSSIKVNGESTRAGHPFTAEDIPAPQDPYGRSKYEAECALKEIAEATGMELVIIRPVLVYGPQVKGNFREMMRWVRRGLPLPLGAIDNHRSLVSVDNLVDFIVACLDNPRASNQVFLVSDGVDFSTPQLLRMTASAMDRRATLVPVPRWMLQWLGKFSGKGAAVSRLCDSLQVDLAKNRDLLGWQPSVKPEAALEKTVSHYLKEHGHETKPQ